MTRISLALALAISALAQPAWGQDHAPWPNTWFHVSVGPASQSVAPTIKGQVYNNSPYRVTDVQLQVEGLNTDSRPVGRSFVWAVGDIVPGGETWFTAEPMPGAISYRITVASFDVVSVGQAP